MTAEAPEQPETFGLDPDQCPHLVAKLRQMNPTQRATILHTNKDTK